MAESRFEELKIGAVALLAAAAVIALFAAAAYGSTAFRASDGPLYNLPQSYRQEVVVDRSNRAFILITSPTGDIELIPYLDEDGEQVIVPQS